MKAVIIAITSLRNSSFLSIVIILAATFSNIINLASGFPVEEVTKRHQWAVSLDGEEWEARKLAASFGLKYSHQVEGLNVYLFEGQWPLSVRISPFWHTLKKREALLDSQAWASEIEEKLASIQGVSFAERLVEKRRVKRDNNGQLQNSVNLNDPAWNETWYMIKGGLGGYDMKVREAWLAGFSGKGVVVTILDDGLEWRHSDIISNYDPAASRDINDADDDPTPRYNDLESNRHGTRCAGIVAAVANNSRCSVGVAFNAKIGGVRLLDGPINDFSEAAALAARYSYVDIYSASWGPDDDGVTVEGPGTLAQKSIEHGIKAGRRGKGSIYVWASGNGGNNYDSCACDGYASSIYTISIGSTSEKGLKPWYLEECASTLASTYSSGDSFVDRQVVTTSLNDKCTGSFSGTSASAPFAAGMIALTLEANPQLTWRDVQHIIVETARTEPLNDANWVTNGVGRNVSTKYGFGLMDGLAMVRLAQRWQTVPQQRHCTAYSDSQRYEMTGFEKLVLKANVSIAGACKNGAPKFLEHVQAVIMLDFSRRGDLSIYLTSPSGTRSQLLPPRYKDRLAGLFDDWPFMSVHFWGESPDGTWTLEIVNTATGMARGAFYSWRLVLYGTESLPAASTLLRPLTPSDLETANTTDLRSLITTVASTSSSAQPVGSTLISSTLIKNFGSSTTSMTTSAAMITTAGDASKTFAHDIKDSTFERVIVSSSINLQHETGVNKPAVNDAAKLDNTNELVSSTLTTRPVPVTTNSKQFTTTTNTQFITSSSVFTNSERVTAQDVTISNPTPAVTRKTTSTTTELVTMATNTFSHHQPDVEISQPLINLVTLTPSASSVKNKVAPTTETLPAITETVISSAAIPLAFTSPGIASAKTSDFVTTTTEPPTNMPTVGEPAKNSKTTLLISNFSHSVRTFSFLGFSGSPTAIGFLTTKLRRTTQRMPITAEDEIQVYFLPGNTDRPPTTTKPKRYPK